MDLSAFRETVLGILREEFASEQFQAGSREDVVEWGETEFSVQNLYVELASRDFSQDLLRKTVVEHFGRVFKMFEDKDSIIPESWEEARPRLRLQLMPASANRPDYSVTYPFLDDVLISVVVDAEHGYAFVRTEDLQRWDIGLFDLYEIARTNLEDASRNLDVSFIAGPPSLLALGSQDGYDAVRILLPKLRQFAVERLGSPFLAGLPNRDFLIMWSEEGSEEYSGSIREQLIDDFNRRSHPLTSRVLRITEDSIKPI